jgi:hypothetical protein
MKQTIRLILCLLVVIALPLSFIAQAHADSFSQNNIIDDAVFDNSSSMSAGQINNWLNGNFPSSCISTNNGFSAPDPTGYNPSAGYTYGGNVSAGQVISDVSLAYGLNPQVILATLQKESSVVSGTATYHCQYMNTAMGYGCPDSGSCPTDPATMSGFSKQVVHAAWLFKFGQQRSLGDSGWNVQLTNYPQSGDRWDNSDDPPTCYGGPMTQGTLSRGCGSASTYYDGYTTIDGTSVHMDTGATAALYWYTPHFSGNQHFFSLFSGWFGSTHASEPPSGLLEVGNQSGKLYFISLDSNSRYYVPTWSTLQAYGLDRYQVIPTDDATINNYTDGGTLKTLVFDNNDQKIYLVDGGKRYWFQQYCSEWGLDCLNQTPGDVTFMTSSYFDNYVSYAGLGQPLQQSNGNYYLMQNGTKEPFITSADMQALGHAPSQAINIAQTDLNATQALGPLQISYPTFFQLNSQMLYFDGQNYHHVPSADVYNAWGARPIVTPPASSYNTTPPSMSSDLGVWINDAANNHYYLVDSGRKIDITADRTNWNSGSFQTLNDNAVNWLGTSSEQANVSVGGGVYIVQNGKKRHVPTYDDYLWLNINPGNTLNLSSYSGAAIPNGTDILRDGGLFTVTGNPGLYVTNGSTSYHIPSTAAFNDFGFNWGLIHFNLDPSVLSSAYPSGGELTRWVKPTGTLLYITHGTQVSVDPTAAANWGINTSTHPAAGIHLAGIFNASSSQTLGQLVRNDDNGGLYYGSGGTYHYITSYAEFVSLGGLKNPPLDVYSDFFTGLTQGSALN